MPNWRVDEVAELLTGNSTIPESDLEKARILAFLLRRKHGVDLRNYKKEDRPDMVGQKRRANELAREIIVATKRGRISEGELRNIGRSVLLAQMKPSILLDGLLNNRQRKWASIGARMKRRKVRDIEISDFSFLSNPRETISNLAAIAEAEAECLTASIDFKDLVCQDIGPWLVLAVARGQMVPIFTGGAISNSMSKVITALDLERPLRFSLSPVWDKEQDIWAFPLKRRRPAGSSSSPDFLLDPQDDEKVADQLCFQIDRWLGESVGQKLTFNGLRLVKKIVGETLDNAERHSRPEFPNDGDWMVSGMMVRREEAEKSTFHCQLAFLSIGSSISDTISTCPPQIAEGMDAYIKKHRGALAGTSFADDHLRTIYALQPEVTQDADAFKEGRGGTGFSDIMNLFADLAGIETAESDASLAIVSGHTCIHIGYPYCKSGMVEFGDTREIWFNNDNSRDHPPDQKNVIELEHKLSGTLVTMGFTLDVEYLERSINGTD